MLEVLLLAKADRLFFKQQNMMAYSGFCRSKTLKIGQTQ